MTDRTAREVLIAHQRLDSPDHCLCGWSELGRSFSQHQLDALEKAGYVIVPTPSDDRVRAASDAYVARLWEFRGEQDEPFRAALAAADAADQGSAFVPFTGSVALMNALRAAVEQHTYTAETSPTEGIDPYLWCGCGWRSDEMPWSDPRDHYPNGGAARALHVHLTNALHEAAVTALQPIVVRRVAADAADGRVTVDQRKWSLVGNHVVEEVGKCTCGSPLGPYPHEPGCGLELVGEVDLGGKVLFDPDDEETVAKIAYAVEYILPVDLGSDERRRVYGRIAASSILKTLQDGDQSDDT